MNNENKRHYGFPPEGSMENPKVQASIEELKAKATASALDFVHKALAKPRNADESFSAIRADFGKWYESEAMLDSVRLTEKDKLYAAWLSGAESAIRRTH